MKSKPKSKSKSRRSENMNKLLYMLINSLLFIFAFVIIYKFWLINLSNDWVFYYYIIPFNKKLTLIFLVNFGLGIIISMIVRLVIGFWDNKLHTMNFIFRSLIQSAIYSLLIWVGVIAYFFDTLDLIDLIIALLLLKFLVFLMADFFSDKLSFGG
jgi:hypothetical protein